MRVAVAFENDEIFQHFGKTETFKLYDIDNGEIVSTQLVDTQGTGGHGALAGFLKNNDVDMLICGGIGGGAQNALADAGIELYGGLSGSADEAVASLMQGTLEKNDLTACDHHGHGEGVCHHGHHKGDEGCKQHHGEY